MPGAQVHPSVKWAGEATLSSMALASGVVIVNLTDSRITLGTILIVFIEAGRVTGCGRQCFLIGMLDWVSREREYVSMSPRFLIVGALCFRLLQASAILTSPP